jgi:hypothetical protein
MDQKIIIVGVIILILIVIGIIFLVTPKTPTPNESTDAVKTLADAAASPSGIPSEKATELRDTALANIPPEDTEAVAAVTNLAEAAVEPAPAPVPEVIAAATVAVTAIEPCLARSAEVYVGCGHVYGKKQAGAEQCGAISPSKIIADSLPNKNICSLARSSPVYMGCGHVYGSRDDFNNQCGGGLQVLKWIGDGL